MYVTVRQYAGVDDRAVEELERLRPGIEALVRCVPGFAAYDVVRTDGGIAIVTVCADRAGVEEATRRVATWVGEHARTLLPHRPAVAAGAALIHLSTG